MWWIGRYLQNLDSFGLSPFRCWVLICANRSGRVSPHASCDVRMRARRPLFLFRLRHSSHHLDSVSLFACCAATHTLVSPCPRGRTPRTNHFAAPDHRLGFGALRRGRSATPVLPRLARLHPRRRHPSSGRRMFGQRRAVMSAFACRTRRASCAAHL